MSSLLLGLFCAALLAGAISVYVFHDVDKDQVGRWNEAFVGLSAESILFAVIIGGPVWLLTLLGRRLFHLQQYFPRKTFALFLGISVGIVQYPMELATRRLLPKFAEFFLAFYLVAAIVLCTVFLLYDCFRRRREIAESVHDPSNY